MTPHWEILYFFITFALGLVALTIVSLTYAKIKAQFLQYYLCFHTVFTILILAELVGMYVEANLSEGGWTFGMSVEYAKEFIIVPLLMFTCAVCMHSLCEVSHDMLRNLVVGSVALAQSCALHLFTFVGDNFETGRFLSDMFVAALFLYTVLTGIQHYKGIRDSIKKKLAERFIVLVGFALPLHIIDTFLENVASAITFYPLIYWGFCAIFSYYFITYYLGPLEFPGSQKLSEPKPEHFQASQLSAEDMLAQYNLSAREQDILPLILKGLSNTEIGEALCISVSTVKTHVTNIYTKFDVKSRYELIALFQKLHFSQEPQDNEE